VIALAGDLDFIGSRLLAGCTAVFIAGWHHATAWQVCAFVLSIRHRHLFSFYRNHRTLGAGRFPITASPLSANLSSLTRPTDQCSGGDTDSKCCGKGEQQMSLHAVSGIIQEFLSGVATLPGGAPDGSYSTSYCVCNCRGRTLGLIGGIGNLICRSFHYCF